MAATADESPVVLAQVAREVRVGELQATASQVAEPAKPESVPVPRPETASVWMVPVIAGVAIGLLGVWLWVWRRRRTFPTEEV